MSKRLLEGLRVYKVIIIIKAGEEVQSDVGISEFRLN